MNIQIIHLDKSDDFSSISDRLRRSKSARIYLVFPPQERVLQNALEYKRLARLTNIMGIQLTIITKDKETAYYCDKFDISHYPSIREVKRSISPTKISFAIPVIRKQINRKLGFRFTKEESTPRISYFVYAGIIISIIITLTTLVLLLFSSATISIHPETITQTVKLNYISSPSNHGSFGRIVVPIHETTSLISASVIIPTSGTMTIPDGYAAGTVRFENLTEEAANIPSGTVVMTSGETPIRFITMEDGVIPAGVGESTLIDVQAIRAGESGNVDEGDINIVTGMLGSMVSGSNPSRFYGGSEKQVATYSNDDTQSAEKLLSEIITDQCKEQLPLDIPVDNIFLGMAPKYDQLSFESFPVDSSPSEYFSLSKEVNCRGRFVTMEDILMLAIKNTSDMISPGYEIKNGFVLKEISPISRIGGYYFWDVTFVRSLVPSIDKKFLAVQLIGKNPTVAKNILASQIMTHEIQKFEIFPDWWPLLPIIPSQIHIEIKE